MFPFHRILCELPNTPSWGECAYEYLEEKFPQAGWWHPRSGRDRGRGRCTAGVRTAEKGPLCEGSDHDLSLLRSGLRHHRPCCRREGDQHRGRPGSSDQQLCSKVSLYQIANNDKRNRSSTAHGADAWKEVEWDWALEKITANLKKARDAGFNSPTQRQVVNRCEHSVHRRSGDNEEVYALTR